MTEFIEFLEECKVSKEQDYSITSMGKNAGCFKVPDESTLNKKFWELYNQHRKRTPVHLTERHLPDRSPVLVDIDFRFDSNIYSGRQYTTAHVQSFAEFYIKEIYNLVPSVPKEQCICFVFEREEPYLKVDMHDGIHLMFPMFHLDYPTLIELRKRVVAKLSSDSGISMIPFKNDTESLIDPNIIQKTNWMLYGSSKLGLKPYKLTKIFDGSLNELPIDDIPEDSIAETLSIRRRDLPLYRGNKCNNNVTEQIERVPAVSNSQVNIQHVKKLIGMLSSTRSESYATWIQVGWCLKNISEDCKELWHSFSSKSTKYSRLECESIWNKFKARAENGFKIGSLYIWAKTDSPSEYKAFRDTKNEEIFSSAYHTAYGTTDDVSSLMYDLYRFQYVCASIKHNIWYEYKRHRWQQIDCGYTLREKISGEILEIYTKLLANMANKVVSSSEEEKPIYEKKRDLLNKLLTKLRTTAFKQSVMQECMHRFFDAKFLESLDSNVYLLGFKNGVYDLQNEIFREGSPDDCISLTTGVNFIEYDPTSPVVQEVYKFLSQVLAKEDIREYFLKFIATTLQGHNAEEKFHIFTGQQGSNGKSKVMDLIRKSLGDYYCVIPVSFLTNKRTSSNACSPELAVTKGKRCGVFQEPSDHDSTINVGLMKEITGNDRIYARALFKDPIEFTPQFKLILICNTLPKIPSTDGGTWRRLMVIPFESKFVHNPTAPNEYKIDEYINEKFDLWKEYFMSILLHYYHRYKCEGNPPPEIVMSATNEYKKKNDVFKEFAEESVDSTGHSHEFLDLSTIWNVYKYWLKENYPDIKPPSRIAMKETMEKYFGKQSGLQGWAGLRLNAAFS
jgi:P4 family phage/plasmid primase-like protien